MPTVHNGIGTWYYGKQRIHTIKGSCPFCGQFTELRSYDTTLFFVVFMVPLIPLSRKRIFEQCAVCSQHRLMPLKQWEEAKLARGAEVLEKLRNNPNDSETIVKALVFAQAYQDEELFDQLVAPLAKDHPGDVAIQTQLGNGYAYFAHWPQAEQAYRTAMASEDSEALRELLAWTLLKQGRPQEARPLLQHVLDNKIRDSAGNVYFLILGYQAAGFHEEALALMDQRDQAFPELVNTKEYVKQRKQSMRYRNSEKRIRVAQLDDGKSGYRTGNWTAALPRWIGALLLVGAVLFYLGSAIWIGQARKVFLVNGAGQPYSVVVNGEEHQLRPGATSVRLAEGDVEVTFADAKLGMEPLRCRVETSFWTRPFASHTLIINPDRTAILVEEESTYAQAPPPPGPPKIHAGQGLYSLPGLDYEFQPFPATLQVQANQTVTKARVDLAPILTPEARLNLMLTQVAPKDQIDYCKRLLRLAPNNVLFLSWLSMQVPAESMIEFLQTHLDDRPLQVEWHRAYQSLMEKAHPETDLVPRYQQIVKETNEAPDAVYLLGRALPDVEKGYRLIRQAAEKKPPSGHALNSMGFKALSDGRFGEAINWFEQALPLVPDKTTVRHYYHEALLANKDYGRLTQELNTQAQVLGAKFRATLELMRVNAVRGEKEKARATMAEALQGTPMNVRASLQGMLEGVLCCCENDVAGFLKVEAAHPGPPTFELLFLRDKLEDAGAKAMLSDHDADIHHALVYLAATRSGAKELAETHWQALLAKLAKGAREERLLGELLAGRKKLAQHPAERLLFEPRTKRVFLAVLAERYPKQAKETLALARTLDYHRDAVSLCLRKALETKNERTEKKQ